MQQLNVLPINVSKNIETKDDTSAFNTSKSKDNFAQHIDSQLAKNKQVTEVKAYIEKHTNKSIEKNDTPDTSTNNTQNKVELNPAEEQKTNGDEHTPKSSTDAENLINKPVDNEQEVADSGKKEDIESKNLQTDTSNQSVDESVLLMDFLNKADNTLVAKALVEKNLIEEGLIEKKLADQNLAQESKANEISVKDKAKHETQLLLKSSELVAELSSVSKAMSSNSTEAVSQDQLSNLITSKAAGNENSTENKLKLSSELLTDEESLLSASIKQGELVEEINAKGAKVTHLTDTVNATNASKEGSNANQQLSVADLAANTLNEIEANAEKAASKELGSQEAILDNENVKLKAKDLITQLAQNEKNNVKDDINKENTSKDDIKDNVNKDSSNLTSTTSATQSSIIKNASIQEGNKSAANATIAQSQNVTDPEINLEAESKGKIENLAEQSKALNAEVSKDATNKLPKTNQDFSINSINGGRLEGTDKTTLEAYNRIEQQSIDILNPLSSNEISQSQKTNTQLHHETIAIFRKDFADAVKDKVMLIVSQKLQQFDITLDPPELGNMQVRVNLQGEQASVNFVVQNQQAKEALDQNMHKLRDLLAAQGVDVGDANVEQQSQQSNKDDTSASDHNGLITGAGDTGDASDAVEHHLSASMLNSSKQGIDYYA